VTSEEIGAAIERLKALTSGCRVYTSTEVVNAVSSDDWVGDLIEVLEQADPDTHMELPRDADGTPIHLGDEMQWRDGERSSVVAIGDDAVFFDDGEGYEYSTPDCVRHYHKPTIEDVLLELVVVAIGDIANKARNENMTYDDWEKSNEVIAEYAEKLREVMS